MARNLDLLEDACGRLPHTTRAMFGGYGLFAPNGGMFAAIVDDDRVVLKLANAPAREELVGLGGAAWTYAGKTTMKEWIVIPDGLYDDAESLEQWVKRAHTLAPAKQAKPAAKSKAAKPAAKSKVAKPAVKRGKKLRSKR